MKRSLGHILASVAALLSAALPMRAQTDIRTYALPEGNYKVTVTLGDRKKATETSVWAETRRLMASGVQAARGESKTISFTVNRRDPSILKEGASRVDYVRFNPERGRLDWDGWLTLAFEGTPGAVQDIKIEPTENVITVFLCGDSTVTNQDDAPWTSWGQIFPLFFDDRVSVANYAESGASLSSFIAENRFEKILSVLKPGDYVFIEFGHNDEKEKGPGQGAWYHYSQQIKYMIDKVRAQGGVPLLLTPIERRFFNDDGTIAPSHGDFPAAVRAIAARESVPLIDLTAITGQWIQSAGPEDSKKAFVEGDNTHSNFYGADLTARMVIQELISSNHPLAAYMR